jgi:bifunctional non-homologous end joining protein LigD
LPFRQFTAANLTRLPDAFDHEDFIFELKMDGFRALAYTDCGEIRLVSRKGNVYKGFPDLSAAMRPDLDCSAVLDGEIVCLNQEGRPQFYDLLRHRREPIFYAFDVLWLDGRDVRHLPLIDRKALLRSILPEHPYAMLYARHIERDGKAFYGLACEQDLEGVVAKLKHGAYGEGWFKIRNPLYSQYEGRRELFEKKRTAVIMMPSEPR